MILYCIFILIYPTPLKKVEISERNFFLKFKVINYLSQKYLSVISYNRIKGSKCDWVKKKTVIVFNEDRKHFFNTLGFVQASLLFCSHCTLMQGA